MKTNTQLIKRQYFFTAEAILKYLLGTSEQIETLILCKDDTVDLSTTDYNLYQALGSVQGYNNIIRAKLVKLLENVDVSSYRAQKGKKKILTHERVEELRKLATQPEEEKNE